MKEIKNPKIRIVDDLKNRNKNNMNLIAGEYFGNKIHIKKLLKCLKIIKKRLLRLMA